MATKLRVVPPDLVDEDLLRSDAVSDWVSPVEAERVRELCVGRSTPEGRGELYLLGARAIWYGTFEPGDPDYPGAESVASQALGSIARKRRRDAVAAWAIVYGMSLTEAAARLGMAWV